MATIRTLVMTLLCGTACVAEIETASDGNEVRTLSDDARAVIIDELEPAPEPDLCDLLPTCGPCSVACDIDALREYVPPGTCAAFLCDLADGRKVSFHACNPDHPEP